MRTGHISLEMAAGGFLANAFVVPAHTGPWGHAAPVLPSQALVPSHGLSTTKLQVLQELGGPVKK